MCAGARHLQTPHSTSVPFTHRTATPKEEACASNSDHRRDSRCGRSRSRRRIRRPDVDRLPRRSRAPLRRGEGDDMEVATQTNKATILRTLVTWANIAPEKPANAANSERPRVQLQRPRRLRAQRAGAGRRGPDDGLGNAEVGQRQQDAQLPPDVDEQLPELHQGARLAVLRPHPRPAVRAVLRDLERVEPRTVPVPAVQLQRQDREPSGLREARGSRLRRHQGGQPQGARRDRRDLLERPQQAGRSARPTRFARARSPRASPRRTRSSSSTRGPITRIPCR